MIVVKHYMSRGKTATACEGVVRTQLPPLKSVSNDARLGNLVRRPQPRCEDQVLP